MGGCFMIFVFAILWQGVCSGYPKSFFSQDAGFILFLPGLEFFRVGPAIVGDTPPDFIPFAIYVLSVSFYGLIYTTVALIVGLILFEDRDLA